MPAPCPSGKKPKFDLFYSMFLYVYGVKTCGFSQNPHQVRPVNRGRTFRYFWRLWYIFFTAYGAQPSGNNAGALRDD
jgi:hypothetical protein